MLDLGNRQGREVIRALPRTWMHCGAGVPPTSPLLAFFRVCKSANEKVVHTADCGTIHEFYRGEVRVSGSKDRGARSRPLREPRLGSNVSFPWNEIGKRVGQEMQANV